MFRRSRRLLMAASSSSGGGGAGGAGPRSSFSSGTSLFLLPRYTFIDTLAAAMRGAWMQISDQKYRDAYERVLEQKIIKDHVLSAANTGTILTYALFANLQNDLFKEYKLDIKEFVNVVDRALETLHDTLGKLRNQRLDLTLKETSTNNSNKERVEEEEENTEDEEMRKLLDTNRQLRQLLNRAASGDRTRGENLWRQQAKEDPHSLAAHAMKMTSENFFDLLYFTTEVDLLTQSLAKYVEGSSKVGEVALLSARADYVRTEQDDVDEFSAASTKTPPVAVQMDVLYEVTHTYTGISLPSTSMTSTATTPFSNKGDDSTNNNTSSASTSTSTDLGTKPDDAKVSVTNLMVAVFEGWLHGGPDNKLRWKVALLREAWEFPHEISMRREE